MKQTSALFVLASLIFCAYAGIGVIKKDSIIGNYVVGKVGQTVITTPTSVVIEEKFISIDACENYDFSYSINNTNGRIKLKILRSVREYCKDSQDDILLDAIKKTQTAEKQGKEVIFRDKLGEQTLRMQESVIVSTPAESDIMGGYILSRVGQADIRNSQIVMIITSSIMTVEICDTVDFRFDYNPSSGGFRITDRQQSIDQCETNLHEDRIDYKILTKIQQSNQIKRTENGLAFMGVNNSPVLEVENLPVLTQLMEDVGDSMESNAQPKPFNYIEGDNQNSS